MHSLDASDSSIQFNSNCTTLTPMTSGSSVCNWGGNMVASRAKGDPGPAYNHFYATDLRKSHITSQSRTEGVSWVQNTPLATTSFFRAEVL